MGWVIYFGYTFWGELTELFWIIIYLNLMYSARRRLNVFRWYIFILISWILGWKMHYIFNIYLTPSPTTLSHLTTQHKSAQIVSCSTWIMRQLNISETLCLFFVYIVIYVQRRTYHTQNIFFWKIYHKLHGFQTNTKTYRLKPNTFLIICKMSGNWK